MVRPRQQTSSSEGVSFLVSPMGFLAYRIIGDPSLSNVLLYYHGFPSSSREIVFAHDEAKKRGLTIVAPDRPGFGSSAPDSRHSPEMWATQVAHLADHLKIQNMWHFGVSGGGPYAMIAAHHLGERSRGLTLISSMAPFESTEQLGDMVARNRRMLAIARSSPLIGQLCARSIALGWMFCPQFAIRWLRAGLCDDDLALLSQSDIRKEAIANARSGCRFWGAGAAHELGLLAKPMKLPGRHESQQLMPVVIEHGEDDRYIPTSIALSIARAYPNAQLILHPSRGHFMLVPLLGEILDRVCARSTA